MPRTTHVLSIGLSETVHHGLPYAMPRALASPIERSEVGRSLSDEVTSRRGSRHLPCQTRLLVEF